MGLGSLLQLAGRYYVPRVKDHEDFIAFLIAVSLFLIAGLIWFVIIKLLKRRRLRREAETVKLTKE